MGSAHEPLVRGSLTRRALMGLGLTAFDMGLSGAAWSKSGSDSTALSLRKVLSDFQSLRCVGEKSEAEAKGGDPRYYVSFAPFYWQKADGTWESRDGHTNPESRKFPDQANFYSACELLGQMANAALLTGDGRWVELFATGVERWFLDPIVGMRPSFRYSQIVPSKRDANSPWGLLAARKLYIVSNGAYQLHERGWLQSDRYARFLEWLSDYARESSNPELVDEIVETANNHLTWYIAHQTIIAELNGQEKRIAELKKMATYAANVQANEQGLSVKEVGRATSLSHAVLNASGWVALFALVASRERGWEAPMSQWPKAGKMIKFTVDAVNGLAVWPGSQIKRANEKTRKALVEAAAPLTSGSNSSDDPMRVLLSIRYLI